MATKKILIIGTGGTIAGKKNSNDDYNYSSGALDVNEIIVGLHNYANSLNSKSSFAVLKMVDINCLSFCNVNSDDISLELMFMLLQTIVYESHNDYDAVIITHGTDTLEETAFFLSLFESEYTTPIVLTGAMLPSDSLNADGPRNLYDAITSICNLSLHNSVYVQFHGKLMNGLQVKKVHSQELDAFTIDNEFSFDSLHNIVNSLSVNYPIINFEFPIEINKIKHSFSPVPVIYFHVDADADIFDYYISRGAKGFVIAGAGAGEYSLSFIEKTKQLYNMGIPVIRTSKIKNGFVNHNETMDNYAVNGLNITPEKAAILLRVLLSTSDV